MEISATETASAVPAALTASAARGDLQPALSALDECIHRFVNADLADLQSDYAGGTVRQLQFFLQLGGIEILAMAAAIGLKETWSIVTGRLLPVLLAHYPSRDVEICAALLEAVSGVPKAAWYSYVGAYYFHKCSALFFFTRWLLRCLIFHLCRLFSTTPTCTPNSPSFPPHRPARSPTMSPMMPDPRYHTNSLTHPPAFHVGNSLWAPEEFCKGVWCMDGWGWGWGWGQKWDRGWLRVGAETGWSWMGLARGGAGKNWLELVGTARD